MKAFDLIDKCLSESRCSLKPFFILRLTLLAQNCAGAWQFSEEKREHIIGKRDKVDIFQYERYYSEASKK